MRFAARASIVPLFLLFATTAAWGAPTSLEATLAKFRLANGEPWKYHLTSAWQERREGREFDVVVETHGSRRLERRCSSDICTGTFYDGKRFSIVGFNQTALPQPRDPEAAARTYEAIAAYDFANPAFRAAGGTVGESGIREVHGQKTLVLTVARNDASPLEAWIDAATYRLRAIASVRGVPVVEFDDFRKVGTLRLPFELVRDGVAVERYTERRIVGEPLEMPSGLRPTFAPAADLEFSGDAPLVSCTIGPATVPCLIDTGSSGLAMSVQLAERLNLDPFGGYVVQGIGAYATGFVRAGPLRVGGAGFPSALYLLLNDIHDHGIDLVIGADVLAGAEVRIDYAAHRLNVSAPGTSRDVTAVPIAFDRLLPMVDVQLGSLPTPLAVDTGDASTIDLSLAFYRQHPELFTIKKTLAVVGVGGASEQLSGEIGSVGIGSFLLRAQRIGATARIVSTEGRLGNGFLAHFTVVLDYAHERLGLIPRPRDPALSMRAQMTEVER